VEAEAAILDFEFALQLSLKMNCIEGVGGDDVYKLGSWDAD